MCSEPEHFLVDLDSPEPRTLTDRIMGGPIRCTAAKTSNVAKQQQ
jgi:hypothetical protein